MRVEGDDPLDPERIRVCGLEDLATERRTRRAPGLAGHGRRRCAGRSTRTSTGSPADPAALHVDHAYGAVADVGAGTFDRTPATTRALAADPFTGDLDRSTGAGAVRRRRSRRRRPHGRRGPGVEAAITDALAEAAAGWADPARRLVGVTQSCPSPTARRTPRDLTVAVPAESRLVLVAAHWRGRLLASGDVEAPVPGVYAPEGLRPHVLGDADVTGERGSSVLLDGLVVEGDVVVEPGELGRSP